MQMVLVRQTRAVLPWTCCLQVSHLIKTIALNASENTRSSRWSSEVTGRVERERRKSGLKSEAPARTSHYIHHRRRPFLAMDPPRTRSRSRSGFFHFAMNGSVGSNGGANAIGNGGLMSASGGGVNYPQQSNSSWAPHHGGRSYPENQQQHTQGSYLSAGAQRHSSHGAHRHPGAGKQG